MTDIRKQRTVIAIAVIVAFVGLLVWSTFSAQTVGCEVCVEFNGGRNCAKATAATEAEAARSAQTTACGPLASGMDESIKCDNTPPVTRACTGG